MIDCLEVLVEEPSAEAALRELLPRFLDPKISVNIHPHQGKADLLSKLAGRLKGYARFLPESSRIVVLLDRDNDDCIELKKAMAGAAVSSRLLRGGSFAIVNRIAIEELEAWFFGDWPAVVEAYPKVKATIPHQSGYRDPDSIAGGTWEAFERILKAAGYMKGGLRKTEAAREIGKRLQPERNTSRSFRRFWEAVSSS
jgi:hypothetical protein